MEFILNPDYWLMAAFFGYPGVAIVVFPMAYWNSRSKQLRMDNVHAYVWGWLAALADALVVSVFWPVWVLAFVLGMIGAVFTIIYKLLAE
ncbi:MAG: hypothetical protein NXH88_10090 [Hyphomonas sp.]|nr:hypothetical protein [Hyphomonas sp.]